MDVTDYKKLGATDFTVLPAGALFRGVQIQSCPYCGASAFPQELSGRCFFVHKEIIGILNSGKLEVRFVMCAKQAAGLLDETKQ